MKCWKCGGKLMRTPACPGCGFIPIINGERQEREKKIEQMKGIIKGLVSELNQGRQEFYLDKLKEMGVL